MHFTPFFIASIEKMCNAFLYCSPALNSANKQLLDGKVLRISLKESDSSLILIFSEHQLRILEQWEGKADCSITTNWKILLKLHDHQQLTSMIFSKELQVEGNFQVMQNFIALIDLTELDLAEIIAPYIGDIFAEGIRKICYGGLVFFRRTIQRQKCYIADIITEEWKIAPGILEMEWFIEETSAINRSVEKVVKRIEKLGEK